MDIYNPKSKPVDTTPPITGIRFQEVRTAYPSLLTRAISTSSPAAIRTKFPKRFRLKTRPSLYSFRAWLTRASLRLLLTRQAPVVVAAYPPKLIYPVLPKI